MLDTWWDLKTAHDLRAASRRVGRYLSPPQVNAVIFESLVFHALNAGLLRRYLTPDVGPLTDPRCPVRLRMRVRRLGLPHEDDIAIFNQRARSEDPYLGAFSVKACMRGRFTITKSDRVSAFLVLVALDRTSPVEGGWVLPATVVQDADWVLSEQSEKDSIPAVRKRAIELGARVDDICIILLEHTLPPYDCDIWAVDEAEYRAAGVVGSADSWLSACDE
ncbi:hypothetical protein [Nocardioides euryhalodurans]|uniref:Uncharacterized protein n=1 Tax=Nocardioides euryhalodurans TaxID=2518370 RepID=A0A4P7GNU5_9ACTN|nr:hypothetical protein [Nocardioides euryhalodurans]QBR93753.1 hypothetical protein EXE57_16825 [Nocardioides euryhalodurans]